MHITQIVQGCQGGITQIPKIDPPKISKQQKIFVWTLLQGSP